MHATETRPVTRPVKRITVVTPCYNEEGNVRALYEAVKELFAGLPHYTYDTFEELADAGWVVD